MTDLNHMYSEIKFWLPLLAGFGMVVKAYLSGKKGVSEWASSLLDNHLHSIETATKSTEFETRRTNTLLTEAATREIATSGKVERVQNTLHEHHDRQLEVWRDVTQALTVLKERTRACSPSRSRSSAKRKKQ
jgi:hypothetical protein